MTDVLTTLRPKVIPNSQRSHSERNYVHRSNDNQLLYKQVSCMQGAGSRRSGLCL